MLCRRLGEASDFFFDDAISSAASLEFRIKTQMQNGISWVWLTPSLKSLERSVVALSSSPRNSEMRFRATKLAIGRVDGSVSPTSIIANYAIEAQHHSARSK